MPEDTKQSRQRTEGSQGTGEPAWFTRANAALARETNDTVRAIAARTLEPGLPMADFGRLLAEAARRAEEDADRRS